MSKKSLLCLKNLCYKQKKRVMSSSAFVMSKNSLLYTTPRLLYEKNPCYPNFAKFSNFRASTIDAQNNTTNNKKMVCIFSFYLPPKFRLKSGKFQKRNSVILKITRFGYAFILRNKNNFTGDYVWNYFCFS